MENTIEKGEIRMKSMPQVTLPILVGAGELKGKSLTVTQTNEKGIVQIHVGLSGIPKRYKLLDIDWVYDTKRSVGKAAAGAIIGGLLTGGIGAIAGVAIGGRRRDNSTAVLHIEGVGEVYVKCNPKEFEKLREML
jgi:hypothetical protein